MPTVQLRDIETEDDVEAVMGLRRAPGQERYLGSMISHFEDAIADARACPRMWSVHDAGDGALVGFAMISDDIPQATLDAEPDIVGPYFLWRLLIDRRFQGRGYGRATIDAVVDYVRGTAGRRRPVHELQQPVTGSPQPFYCATGSSRPTVSPTARTSCGSSSGRTRTEAEPERPADHPPRQRDAAPLAGQGTQGRESGLTGDPDIPDPPEEGPTDLRGRIEPGPPGRPRDRRRRPPRPRARLGREPAG